MGLVFAESFAHIIYTRATNRADIVNSMRARHAYAATDNIVLDFEAVEPDGKTHMMGDIFTSRAPVKLRMKVFGTDVITQVDLMHNNEFIYTQKPGTKNAEFEYVDQAPKPGTNWYYVRVTQIDRNLAWSSPVWIDYRQ